NRHAPQQTTPTGRTSPTTTIRPHPAPKAVTPKDQQRDFRIRTPLGTMSHFKVGFPKGPRWRGRGRPGRRCRRGVGSHGNGRICASS
ncbi:hypothetical protein E0F15_23350, partial [Frankia sp. B2]